MWKWFSRSDAEPDAGAVERSRITILFNHFRRILELNNEVLGALAAMERAMGGEYIFDNAFLDSSVRNISSLVHHVIYSLNALTNNRHVPLYDRFQDIRSVLDGILSGGLGPHAETPVLPFDDLGWELEALVGIEAVCQAELRRHSGIHVADGFVLTVVGTRLWSGLEPGVALRTDRLPSREKLRDSVREQVDRLVRLRKAPDRLALRLVRVTGSEQEEDGESGKLPEMTVPSGQVLEALDQLLGKPDRNAPPMAVVVNCAHNVSLRGSVRTRDLESGGQDGLHITAELLDGEGQEQHFLLKRTHPFDLMRSHVSPCSLEQRLPDGYRPTSPGRTNLLRGSALVDIRNLRSLADTAMALERMLGMPAELHWAMREEGAFFICRLRPLPNPEPAEPDPALLREVRNATILCSGGRPVQSGIVAGRVVHVTDDMAPEQFPPGAVAVSRSASPRLTPILQRAGAVITELGTPAGHLAAVARELRLPAVFGLPEAIRLLPSGAEVTLDAAETVVYQGVLEGLLRYGRGAELYPTDPEYHTLRRLLRFISPLNLTDPHAASFTPHGCRTYHDIIHYCHEMSVEELANFQEHHPDLRSLRARSLKSDLVLPVRMLDIGGGLAGDAPFEPGIKDVKSQPLSAFLDGLQQAGAWDTTAASLSFRDVFASLPRSMAQFNASPASLGDNLAIISRDYLNLSLRLGYHFSVVDAYLGPDPERSHIYFRFAGGLADPARRARRARMIRDVLDILDFNTTMKDDLVVGSLKQVDPSISMATLTTLGALTAFVRQRDTAMSTDQDEQQFFEDFERNFLNRKPHFRE